MSQVEFSTVPFCQLTKKIMTKTKCRPTRTKSKPGPKSVSVKTHKRSTPKKLRKCK